jgi:hypothetical protein
MKHTISLLLLLSVSGISQCASGAGHNGSYNAVASNGSRKKTTPHLVGLSTVVVTQPTSSGSNPANSPAANFAARLEVVSSTRLWNITKKQPNEKQYPSWDHTSTSISTDPIARKIQDLG